MGIVWKTAKEAEALRPRWIDARFSLLDAEGGRRQYKKGHLPGAVHWDLEKDLSDASAGGGRHPLPSSAALARLFCRSGLHLHDAIGVYDEGGGPFAARAWWTLRYAGFANAFILNEPYKVAAEQFGEESTAAQPVPSKVVPKFDEHMIADRADVQRIAAGLEPARLLDARAAARFEGKEEPIDRVAGHIPGAQNAPWESLKDGPRFVCAEELRARLRTALPPGVQAVAYCGSGVTAAPLYAALIEAGYPSPKLYVGSYSDWTSAGEPVEIGKAKPVE